jgi:hypothetical protein
LLTRTNPRMASLSGYVVPKDEDVTPEATDQRARRSMRKVDEHDEVLGNWSYTDAKGVIVPATGICAVVEKIRDVDWDAIKQMAADWSAAKKRREKAGIFAAEQSSHIVSHVIILGLTAIIIALGWGKYIGH